MATYESAPKELITCPYDVTHRVLSSRYQLHIAKCEARNREVKKLTCPFNAQHRCEQGTYSYHLMNCPDRAALDKKLVASSENNTFKGHTGVPSYNTPNIEPRENWDVELAANPSPAYEPRTEPPNGGFRTNFAGMLPSQRKLYYKNLHHRDLGDEESEEAVGKEEDTLPELRKPKTKSYAQILDQKPVHELQNVGLGRGQPTGSASSRIAANIFGDKAKPMRQPRSSPNIPGLQPPTLGMGRGGSIIGAARQGEAAEIDVNHIGLGRGVNM